MSARGSEADDLRQIEIALLEQKADTKIQQTEGKELLDRHDERALIAKENETEKWRKALNSCLS